MIAWATVGVGAGDVAREVGTNKGIVSKSIEIKATLLLIAVLFFLSS